VRRPRVPVRPARVRGDGPACRGRDSVRRPAGIRSRAIEAFPPRAGTAAAIASAPDPSSPQGAAGWVRREPAVAGPVGSSAAARIITSAARCRAADPPVMGPCCRIPYDTRGEIGSAVQSIHPGCRQEDPEHLPRGKCGRAAATTGHAHPPAWAGSSPRAVVLFSLAQPARADHQAEPREGSSAPSVIGSQPAAPEQALHRVTTPTAVAAARLVNSAVCVPTPVQPTCSAGLDGPYAEPRGVATPTSGLSLRILFYTWLN
jgi:hypothetical protein